MTTPHARDFRLSKNEYVIQCPVSSTIGLGGGTREMCIPVRSRCRGVMMNIWTEVGNVDQVTSCLKNRVALTPTYTIPANTGPDGNGDVFEYLDFTSDPDWAKGTNSLYLPGDSIQLFSDAAGDSSQGQISYIMVKEEAVSDGMIFTQISRSSLGQSGGVFVYTLMNRDVVVRGVFINAVTAPDAEVTYEVEINSSATVPASTGLGLDNQVDLEGAFVGIRNVTVPKYSLLHITHDADTSLSSIHGALLLASHGPLNERCEQFGHIPKISTADVDFSIRVCITEPSVVKGIVIHLGGDLFFETDEIDIWKLRVNGADLSPSVTFRGSIGLAYNAGEFIGPSRRVELLPGDLVQLRSGGQSSGGLGGSGKVFASLVLQV